MLDLQWSIYEDCLQREMHEEGGPPVIGPFPTVLCIYGKTWLSFAFMYVVGQCGLHIRYSSLQVNGQRASRIGKGIRQSCSSTPLEITGSERERCMLHLGKGWCTIFSAVL